MKQSSEKTKKDNKEINLSYVLNETKKDRDGMSMHLFAFVMLTLICLMLAYVLPYSLIVTLPFVIVPSYFAYTGTNIAKKTKGGEDVGFFRMYRVYFTQLFFGGYRLIIGILKSFLVYMIIEFGILLVFEYTLFPTIPGYNAILEKITTADISGVLDEFMAFMNSNEAMLRYTFLATSISLVIAVFFFIQHIGKHSLKIRRNLLRQPPLPMSQINYVYKRVRSENRSELIKAYIKCTWFYKLLLILAGAGGILISFFALKNYNSAQAVVVSLALMLIVSIPFFNYLAKMQDLMYFKIGNKFEETNITVTLELINRFKDKINISEEDAKKIQEMLEETKKASEKALEEDKKDLDKEE